MDAPFMNGEPGAMPYDREWNRGGEREPEAPSCRDCGEPVYVGGAGTPAGTYCTPCVQWRERAGLLFDARTKLQIQAAMRRDVA